MFGRPKRHTIGPAALHTEEQLSTEGGALHQRAAGGPEAPLCKGSCQREAMTEGLMLSKSKIAKHYSNSPGFKNKLESIYKPMSTRQIYYRPPGARFFLLQRRKNRGRKTLLRAGGPPPTLRTHPGYGVGTTAAHCTGYQADLHLHPYPASQCADRLPLRCSLRTAVVTWRLVLLMALG